MFDLDDTLVDHTGAIDRVFIALAEERSWGAEGLAFLRAEQARPVDNIESLNLIIEKYGTGETPDQLADLLNDRVLDASIMFDGVLTALARLRDAGWALALVTNGYEVSQRRKLRDGLLELFDTLCFSGTQGVWKPDPRIFVAAAANAGFPPESAWVVGDSWGNDVAGAAAVGARSIWVSHGRTPPTSPFAADVIVPTAVDACDYLWSL
ncbi:HAD superfamily hydrolase (TIGR01509 family)/HAD superfamily hydrolase (TIGR01549 family) [Rudaeicoccus suwonensis]|uniref:HAD superfamily hydrolase (TIGR01509 family)/HAD superfamily hydrolase (TIGR01549 family) n=2 Tax=Rudaeicoccus suwonensis TaxID=657409 RepID=A0A561DVN3_9MICO|nr:HAD superfamily hydrolase (TIGR01509 family)/HAD superfamily hydrolase (TIGR01549 family) [Rudaeicoccus suwonensis]